MLLIIYSIRQKLIILQFTTIICIELLEYLVYYFSG
jgi:hypothetical protein